MSSLLKNWSIYVKNWRREHGYSKKIFCHAANMDLRSLRDLEEQHFQSRFYSVASTAEYIRQQNLLKQLIEMQVENPHQYLPLIEILAALSPGKRHHVLSHFIEYFQLLKEKPQSDS